MTALKVTAIQTTAGVEVYPAKLWINFNGVGVVYIRGSGNMSSVTDGGVGYYTANFSVTQPDIQYSYHNTYTGEVSVQVGIGFLNAVATTALSLGHYNPANSVNTVDKGYVTITIHR